MASGILYGISTGPGDPELVTRKAWAITSRAEVIAYPSTEDGDSFARRIMDGAIAPGAIEIKMPVPMVSGRAPAQSIYDKGAEEIRKHLKAGRDVAVLCEGDALFYGSFMYILARLRDDFAVEIIPGVTSMTACAAVHRHGLVARNDVLVVLPAPLDDEALSAQIDAGDAVAIIKIGRHFERIKNLLTAKGLAEGALYVSHASLPHEQVMPLNQAPENVPYFSMILLYKGDDPWI